MRRALGRLAFVATLIVVSVGACGRTFYGTARQPNPLNAPTEVTRNSEKITIVTGDMDLRMPFVPGGGDQPVAVYRSGRYPLLNEASFTVVSRDRLRFHVQLDHKWEDWADVTSWEVTLTDDQGNVYSPEAKERAKTRLMVTMWDMEQRSAVRNQFGDIVGVNNDGWRRRMPLGSLAVFRGNADLVFYRRDIFRPDLKWVKLKISRFGVAFQFMWKFTNSGDSLDRTKRNTQPPAPAVPPGLPPEPVNPRPEQVPAEVSVAVAPAN